MAARAKAPLAAATAELGDEQTTTMPLPNTTFVGLSLIPASVGALWDLRTRRIPNWLTGPSLLAGLALHLAIGGWHALGLAFLAALLGGGVFFLFFLAGGMGAGDVKIMAAICAIAGLNHVAEVLIATAVCGGIFGICAAFQRGLLRETIFNVGELFGHHLRAGLKPHADLNVENTKRVRLPYGVAIAAGVVTVLCMGLAG